MSSRDVVAALAVLVVVSLTGARAADSPPDVKAPAVSDAPMLAKQVQALDDRLSTTFNAHDLDGLMALFADDLEFFHDKDGLQHFADTKAGFAGLFAQNTDIRRELVKESFAVYPVPGYGAMQLGTHRFCHHEKDREECGSFEFVHVWRREGAGWKLARVISYGH